MTALSAALSVALMRPFIALLRCAIPVAVGLAVSAGAAIAAPDEGPAPPGRVGQLSLLSGPVTLTDVQTREQQPAALNWPLTSGMRLTTGGWGRAEVRIGSLTLRLDGDSEIDFSRIDDELIQMVIRRGSVALRARSRDLLPEIDVTTLRERVTLDDAGRYRVDVDRAAGITALTVFSGAARIAADRLVFDVRSGQRGEFSTLPNTGFALQPAARDAFDDWVASRERREEALASSRYVSPEMTGIEALDEHGTWRSVPEYGTVWFPRVVVSGWVPYRYGRWVWVSPWGWTWIDDAPWGFAPFHYGRWVTVSGAWCWVPGAWVARPVYAPALVAWVGVPGVSVSVGLGTVGWFPLGPREVYVPPYRHPPRYVDRINLPHVPHVRGLPVAPPPVYVNQTPRASTWVPADAIGRHEPIRHQLVPGPADPARWVARPVPPPSVVNPTRPLPTVPAIQAPPTPADGGARPLPPVPSPTMPAVPPTAPRLPDRPAEIAPRMLPPTAGRPSDERAPPPRIDMPRPDAPRPGAIPGAPPFTPPAQPVQPPQPAAPAPGAVQPPTVAPPAMPRHDHVAPPPRVAPPRPPQAIPVPGPDAQRPPGVSAPDTPGGARREPPRREPRAEGRADPRSDGRNEGRSDPRGDLGRSMRP